MGVESLTGLVIIIIMRFLDKTITWTLCLQTLQVFASPTDIGGLLGSLGNSIGDLFNHNGNNGGGLFDHGNNNNGGTGGCRQGYEIVTETTYETSYQQQCSTEYETVCSGGGGGSLSSYGKRKKRDGFNSGGGASNS